MKKNSFLFLSILLMSIWACKDDDCHDLKFKNYEVDFFNTHKDLVLIPATFDTVTETILVTEAHLEGAVFETVTEQILVKGSYTKFNLMDSTLVPIIINAEIDTFSEIVCYHFFEDSEFTILQVPAQYTTLVGQRVVQQGTGAEVPATYSTITKILLDTPSQIIETPADQKFQRVKFRIPEKRTIRGHLDYYFEQQSIENCREGKSYRILD